MGRLNRIITWSSYVALACGWIWMSTGCGTGDEKHAETSQVKLEVRFQDDTANQQPSADLRTAAAEAGPITHDTVTRIQVDITFADTGLPFTTNFDLTKVAPDVWQGDVPILPRNQQLRFDARALSTDGDVAFSGETLATLTIDNQDVQIPLAPVQNGQTFPLPRMFRIVYPAEMFAGQEEQVSFTIESNAGEAIGIQITANGAPTTPSADFSPATGTLTLTNTVADLMTVYTPPAVTVETDFDYQVTITDARAQSAVAITTNFSTHVKPRPPGGDVVHDPRPNVLFNPVILSLNANGSEVPGTVELVADVSDDSAPDKLAFQWSYTPHTGTPSATFENNGQGNPGLFQNYTLDHQGTIDLAVTDEHNGTTTLHYPLALDQFADAIDHASVSSLKRIVAGDAHTCVLTGANRVRCWGDNQFGQLGYGNTTDVGDMPTRLPFTAGDVPLPGFDPVQQLVAGNDHTCVLLASGLVSCWGRNNFGQLGYNRTDNLGDGEAITSFGFVPLDAPATLIAAGGDHTCAVLQSGALRCWGRNDFGQLGHGNTANIGDNETVSSAGNVDLGPGVTVKDLALGGFHTCALLTTGAVRCWGRGSEGQLGYGNTEDLGDDEPINNLPDVSLTGAVRKIVAGSLHTCALTFAGALRCWGDGRFGQLGQSFSGDSFWGNATNELPSTLPGDIITGAQVIEVTAGDSHTCALSSDGLLKCWGLGTSGQLGYGDFNDRFTPSTDGVDLDGVTAYQIAAGAAHTCALRNNGTARCWGQGEDGRLGRGSTTTSPTATGNVDIQIFASLTVGGTVSGLAGQGLVLRNKGGDDLPVNADGTFTFPTALLDLSSYAVTVRTQPINRSQTCTVLNGSGNLAGANVTSVAVTCTTNSFTVGGSVSGLAAGDSITLRDNGGDTQVQSANGSFTFATPVASGQPYAVTVVSPTSPISQACTVTNGAGTVGSGNVTSVAVTCTTNSFTVGGSVSGLAAGDSITLRDNGGDTQVRSANGNFTFATPVASGQPYAVTVVSPTSPISQTCTVTNDAGTIGSGNVTNVAVTCTTNSFTVGGSVSGLAAGDSITLRDNGGDTQVRSANGSFTFATPVASGQPYAVTIVSPTSPIPQTCTVTNGAGMVGSGNVTSIAVTCTTSSFTVGGSVAGLTVTGLVLQNNGNGDLPIVGSGGFTFAIPVASGATYNVTIKTQPLTETCRITNGTGTVGTSNITNVQVTCAGFTLSQFPIAVPGTTFGLGDLALDNNGDLLVTVNPARSIVRVSRATGAQSTVASNIGAAGGLLTGIAYRAANNTIYASSVTADGVTSQLFAVAPNGTTTLLATISGVLTIAIAPPSFGSFGGFIIGVTTSSTDTAGSVIAVNPSTGAVTTIVAAAGPTSDLDFAPNGTLFICGASTVHTVTATGVMSTFASGFTSADGITITPDGARMFIADSGTDTVRQVTIPGAAVTTFASADIDDGFGVGGIIAAPGNTLLVMTGETSLTLRAFTF